MGEEDPAQRYQCTFRPEPAEYTDGQSDLAARDLQMNAFLRACLRALHEDPDGFLRRLARSWPEARQVGRPRGNTAAAPTTAKQAGSQPGPAGGRAKVSRR